LITVSVLSGSKLKEIAPKGEPFGVLGPNNPDGSDIGSKSKAPRVFGTTITALDVAASGDIRPRNQQHFAREPNGGIARELIVLWLRVRKFAYRVPLPLLCDDRSLDFLQEMTTYALGGAAPRCRSYPQGREAIRPAGAGPTKYELVINLKTQGTWTSPGRRSSLVPTR
jgi:hypothetical protein